MTTKGKARNSSKVLDISVEEVNAMLEAEISKYVIVELLPTDITVERIMARGMSEMQARTIAARLVKHGGLTEIRYKTDNGGVAKAYRKVVK